MRAFIITTILLTPFISFAQFNFGIKGGLSGVKVRYLDPKHIETTNTQYEWRPSYHAGIFFKYKIAKRTTMVVDLIFSDKGFKYGQSSTHLLYLNLPLTFRYSLYKKLSIEGGGEIGELGFAYSKYNNTTTDRIDYFGNYVDLGILGGVVYDLTDRISLTLRYTHGLSNILNKKATVELSGQDGQVSKINIYDQGVKYTNQAIYLSLGYIIRRPEK